jgi:hypothetical protein
LREPCAVLLFDAVKLAEQTVIRVRSEFLGLGLNAGDGLDFS